MNESVEYAIRVVLKARDQLAATLAKARAEIEAFEASARDADDAVGGLNDRITSLNKRAASASERLGRLKKQTDEYGGSVRDLIAGENESAKSTERRGKAIDDVTKIEIRSAGEQRRAREEQEKGTASAKRSAAATKQSAKEKLAETRAINEHAKALGLDAEAESRLDKELKERQKSAKAAGQAFKDFDKEFQAAIAAMGEDSSVVKENRAEHERLKQVWEDEKTQREAARGALSDLRKEHRGILDQARAEIESGKATVEVEKEQEVVVKKTTTAKRSKTKASKDSSSAVKEDTKALADNTVELKKNAEAEDVVLNKKKYRKTVIESAPRPGAPGSPEAKAAIARVRSGQTRESSVRPATDQDLEDLLSEHLGELGGFGGGAPRKSDVEKKIAQDNERLRKREENRIRSLRTEYNGLASSVGNLFREYGKGDRDLESLQFHLGEIAKRFDQMGRSAARFGSPQAREFVDQIRVRAEQARTMATPGGSQLFDTTSQRRIVKGIDPAPLKKSEVAAEELNKTVKVTNRELDRTYNAGRRAGRGVEDAGRGMRKTVREAETLGQAFGNLSQRIDHTGGGVAALDNRLRGLLVLGVIAFSQQLITALISVGGALTAVASSAAMAGGAIGGALAAGIAQALPVLGLFVASLGRVKEVMQAVQQSQLVDMQQFQRRNDNQKKDANAADMVANAQDQVRSADERLAQAHRTLAERQKALTQAREDAVKKIRDLIAAEHDAELAAMGAAKSQADAQDALRKAVATGDVTGVGGAELGLLQAQQQRRESITALADAHRAARRAVRGGVEQDPGVVQARQQAADARRGITDAVRGQEQATRALEKAQRGSAFAAANQFSGLEKLQWLLQKRLSPAERELYTRINDLQKVYKSQFRSVTDILIGEYANYVGTATKLLKDPAVINGAKGLATGLAGQMARVRREFSSNEFIRQILRIMGQARKNLGPLTSIFINLAHAFVNFAEAAGPSLTRILKYLDRLSGHILDISHDKSGLNSFFDKATTNLLAWMDALGAVIQLFGALIGIGQSSGLSMITDFTKQVQSWTEDIRSNRGEVSKFFDDSKQGFYDLLRLGAALVKAMFDIFDPAKMGHLVDFLQNTLLPAFVTAVKLVGQFTSALLWILNLPGISTAVKILTIMLLISKAVTSLSLLYQGLIDHLGKFFRIVETTGWGRQFTSRLQDMGRAAGGLLTTIGKLIAQIPGLGKFGTALGGAFQKAGRRVSNAPTLQRRGAGGNVLRAGEQEIVDDFGNVVTVPRRSRGQGDFGDQIHAPRTPMRRRIARGAGIAAVVGAGAYGLSQGQQGLQDIGQGVGGRLSIGLNQLSGLAQQITSLDIGGALHTIFGGGRIKDLQEFAKSYNQNIKTLYSEGNIEGLKKLHDRALDLAKSFPQYADGLKQAADEAGGLIDKLGVLGGIPPVLRAALRKNRIEPDDIANPSAAAQFLDNLNRLRFSGVRSIKELRDNLSFNIQKIGEGFKTGSKEAGEAMSSNFRNAFTNLRRMARDGTITHGQYMREMARLTTQQMQYMRDNMDTLSAEARGRFADNMHQATQAAIAEAGGIEHATEKALKHIRRLMSTEFQAYGLDAESARRLARNRTTSGRGNIDQFGKDAVATGGQGGATGFLGMPGERGPDALHMVLGRGEAVLNWAHQKIVNSALWQQYGMTLQGLFKGTRAKHGIEYPGIGMAAGGIPKNIVPIPGQGGNGTPVGVEYINASIKNLVQQLVRRYHLTITDAYDPTGTKHASPGHEVTGTAVDFIPGPGGSWPMLEAMGKLMVSRGLTVGYDSHIPGAQLWPNHGRGNHIHVEFGGGAGPGARAVAAVVRAVRRLRAPQIHGGGQFGLIAQLGVNAVTAAANRELRRATRNPEALGGPYPSGQGANGANLPQGQIRSILAHALRLTGHYSSANLDALYGRAMQESSGNPRAINLWDSNAAKGTPSKGLLQTIDSTFQKYRLKNLPNNIFNALSNAAAAIRYMYATYGHIVGPSGSGYDVGGEIPGHPGSPRPILAHAGEWVLNKGQQFKAAAAAGMSVQGLKSMLGFYGGPSSYAGGGDTTKQPTVKQDQNALDKMFTTAFEHARQRAIRVRGLYNLPEILPQTWDSIIKEIGRATSTLRNHASNWNKRINALTQVIRDDELGLLNLLEAARQRQANTRQRALTFRQFAVSTVAGHLRVTNQRDPQQLAGGALANARDNLSDIRAEEHVLNQTQAVVTRRLAALRRGGVSQREAGQVRRLQANLNLLHQKFQDLRDAEAEAISSLYDAQVAAQQAAIDKINSDADKATTANSLMSRVASALGNTDWLMKINEAQRGVLSKQADDLAAKIAAARAIGNNDLADQLQQQVNDLRVQVFESVQADIQAAADQVNNQAQRRLGRVDLFNRMSDALGKVGLDAVVNVGGEMLSRRGVFQARQDALTSQRTGLQSVLQQAMDQQNVGLIQSLTDQLAELDVQIQENTKALFDARVAEVNRATDQTTKVIDYQKQILDLQGAISGVTDIAGEIALEQQRTAALQNQRDQLQGLLAEAVASGNDQAVIDLTNQLYENQIALLQNTQAINELNGQSQSPQTFTSTAWQWFRDAIFTGMGGVMPQYVVPGAATGGIVTKSGLVYVHTGEPIQPASIIPADFSGGGGDHIETHIHSVDGSVPMTELVSSIAWAKKTAQVRKR